MKNLITVVTILLSLTVGVAHAAKKEAFSRPYGLAGCGLGNVLLGKKGGQIFASTTNGTSSNQLFGITSGTLNCSDGPNSEVAQNMDKFIVANRSALTADIAKGNGETLAALSQVMGCKADPQSMGQALKSNYNTIFVDETTAPNEVTDSIISVIRNDQQLASSCPIS